MNIKYFIRHSILVAWDNTMRLWKKLQTVPGLILLIGAISYLVLMVFSFFHHCGSGVPFWLYLSKEQLVTFSIGLLAAIVVYFQIVSLKEQLQAQTLMEYSKQWSSSAMVARRKAAMHLLKYDDVSRVGVDLEQLEKVLELLEDFSTLAEDDKLIWDSSLGWYASRYFYYSYQNKSIKAIREKWGFQDEPDETYYEKLEKLYDKYVDNEAKYRGIKIDEVKRGYLDDKKKFIHAENDVTYPIANKEDFKLILIELRPSNIHGVGVFAIKKINEKQFVAEGIHREDYEDLVSWEEAKSFDEDIKKKIHDFCIGTPDGFYPPEDKDFSKLSVEWYMNHSCNGNVGFNENGDFVAIKDIEKDEELTYDYGLAESYPDFIMECHCGNSNCRKTITGNDWRDSEIIKNNLAYMLPALRKSFN